MRLWEYDEFGEPWLENSSRNPPLLIVNSKKKGKKKMAAKRRRKGVRRSPARKAVTRKSRSTRSKSHTHWGKVKGHRRRVNPWPLAGTVVGINPRRRRKASNRKRHSRKKSYHRNPAILGITLPPIQTVIYAGAGFVGTPMLEGFLSKFLPITLTSSTIGRYGLKIASALGLSFLTKMVLGASEARMVAIGGGVYVLSSALVEFVPGTFGRQLSAYRPATLSSYVGSTSRTFNQLGAQDIGGRNTPRNAPFGASNLVATRFRRFN